MTATHLAGHGNHHRLSIVARNGQINMTVVCSAPQGSDCRVHCPSGCEEWDSDYHECGLVDSGNCLAVESFDSDWIEDYVSIVPDRSVALRHGLAVDVFWDGKWMWSPVRPSPFRSDIAELTPPSPR